MYLNKRKLARALCAFSLFSVLGGHVSYGKELSSDSKEAVQEQLKERYYLAGNPEQWFFVMGPVDSNKQTLRLQRPYNAGNIMFGCNYTGKEELALTVAGLMKPDGWKGLAHITINGDEHDAKIESKGQPSHEIKTIINFVDKNEIAGILLGMSRASQARKVLAEKIPAINDHDYIYMHISIEGYNNKIPIPPIGFSENTLNMCTKWYNAKFLEEHGFDAPNAEHTHNDNINHTGLHFNYN